MSWQLTASGHCDDPADERDLTEKVTRLLSGAKYGTSASQLAGESHNGPVHEVPRPAAKGRPPAGKPPAGAG